MKCQNLFSGENEKNIINSSAELAQRAVKVTNRLQIIFFMRNVSRLNDI